VIYVKKEKIDRNPRGTGRKGKDRGKKAKNVFFYDKDEYLNQCIKQNSEDT